MRTALLCFFLFAGLARAEEAVFPFVLPWDDASASVMNLSDWLEQPAGKQGFIKVRDGHLYAGDQRIRFLGINTCFGASFPEHADAEKITARMAKFGINCVRFHHMDGQSSPNGLLKEDKKTLDPGQLDKLDYFIAKLKEHGIYANLNLHVSRSYPGMPEWKNAPGFFKGVDLFYPPMIEEQKTYARELLTHVNPYTKLAYVDDPAVAIVEINNENGLILEWWNGKLDDMPEAYATVLRKRWNEWLSRKYAGGGELEKAWALGTKDLGKELLGKTGGWNLEQHFGARAALGPDLNLRIDQPGPEAWHVQLSHPGIAFEASGSYTLVFQARADAPRTVEVVAAQSHDPWKRGWIATIQLSTEWQEFRFVFNTGEDFEKGRILFSGLGKQAGSIAFKDVSLRPGGVMGLLGSETYGSIGLFRKQDLGSRTLEARKDWMRFLRETEEDYWTGMRDFLKKELKVKSLLVGTAVGFSPPDIQAKLDVVDGHAYWKHPRFPGKSWDPEDWTVENVPMAGDTEGGALDGLAFRRVKGKPFIVTEYNSSAPNTYAGETYPLLAAYAALQDWDGIFAFAYSHRANDWDARRMRGFFDIDQHPVKMATLPATAALFLRGDIAASKRGHIEAVDQQEIITGTLQSGPWWDITAFAKLERWYPFLARVGMIFNGDGPSSFLVRRNPTERITSETSELTWNMKNKRVTIESPRSIALIGATSEGETKLWDRSIQVSGTLQDWSAVTVTAMQGDFVKGPGIYLVTASGWSGNTDMQWKDEKKNSVGRNWGKAPSLVEGIRATLTWPADASRIKVTALDEKGQPKGEVPVVSRGGVSLIKLGPEYKTLWYQVEVN